MAKIDKIKDEHEKFVIKELKKRYKLSDRDYNISEKGHIINLNLSNRNLNKIPEYINNLSYLQMINLSHNNITRIMGLNNLLQLKKLNLHANNINKISGLENLSQLREINLLHNKIKKIEGLENLSQLQKLNLYDNLVKKIEGLGNLQGLLELHLNNNPLLEKDKKIYQRGVKAVVEYCEKNIIK